MKKSILVIGGTRFVGRAIVEELLKTGFKVVVYHRGQHQLPFDHENLFEEFGNCKNPLAYAGIFKKYGINAVIHNIAYHPEDVAGLRSVLNEYKVPIIVISTGQTYLVTVNKRQPYDEAAYNYPLLPAPQNDDDYKQWLYGVYKRDVERLLDDWYEQYNIPSVTLRCPVIQGEYDYSYRLFSYIARVKDGRPLILPYEVDVTISHLFVKDLVKAITLILTKDISGRNAYNLSGEERIPLSQFIGNIGEILERDPELFEVSTQKIVNEHPYLKTISPYSSKWVSVLDASSFKTNFNWKPTPINKWFPAVVKYQADNFLTKSLFNYTHRGKELSFIADFARYLKKIN